MQLLSLQTIGSTEFYLIVELMIHNMIQYQEAHWWEQIEKYFSISAFCYTTLKYYIPERQTWYRLVPVIYSNTYGSSVLKTCIFCVFPLSLPLPFQLPIYGHVPGY